MLSLALRAAVVAIIARGALFCQLTNLTFVPIDAKYSTSLDRMIVVSANPNQLHIYDGRTNADTVVSLPDVPRSVSVSPNGYFAAVGHLGSITHVNLTNASVARVIQVATEGNNILLSNEHAFISPAISIDLSSGAVAGTNYPRVQSYGGVLNDASNKIYESAFNGQDFYTTDVSSGVIPNFRTGRTVPFHFDPPLWLSNDRKSIYTGSSYRFTVPDLNVGQPAYLGMFPGVGLVLHLAEAPSNQTVATIPFYVFREEPYQDLGLRTYTDLAREVHIYDTSSLSERSRFILPQSTVGTQLSRFFGCWLFFSADSGQLFVIVKGEVDNQFAIFRMDLEASPNCVQGVEQASFVVESYGTKSAFNVTAQSECIYTVVSDVPWISISQPATRNGASSMMFSVVANRSGNSRTGTIRVGSTVVEVQQKAAQQALQSQIRLPYNVIDAEYDRPLDRLIMVSSEPYLLHIFDPETAEDQTVALDSEPLSVSVRPDGLYAAVGQRGTITIVNLQSATAEHLYRAPANIRDLVLAGNGFLYAVGDVNVWPIYSLELSTGKWVEQDCQYSWSRARLHPLGRYIAGINYNASKVGIVNGWAAFPVSYVPNLFQTCGNLWFSAEGSRILTACGTEHISSDSPNIDGTYIGKLSAAPAVRHADDSGSQGYFAVVPNSSDDAIQIYDDQDFSLIGRIPLTPFQVQSSSYQAHGRFAFWSRDGSKLIVVTEADSKANLLGYSAIQTVSPTNNPAECTFSLSAGASSIGPDEFTGSITLTTPAVCVWKATASAPWLRVKNRIGVGSGTLQYTVEPNSTSASRSAQLVVDGQTLTITQAGVSYAIYIAPASVSVAGYGSTGKFAVTTSTVNGKWSAVSKVSWITLTESNGIGQGTVSFSVATNLGPTTRIGGITVGDQVFSVTQEPFYSPQALRFVSVTPSRAVDTRNINGPLGGPLLNSGQTRSFRLPSSACSLPWNAVAYSINLTVVPVSSLPFVTTWPTGRPRPLVSTLNSLDGRIKANAAIVPAGTDGNIDVYAAGATHVVIDVNGYFMPSETIDALAFYSLPPCRIIDTRAPVRWFGGQLGAGETRTVPLSSSDCNVPSNAQAFSFNVTAVPKGLLPFVTLWPTGKPKPLVSTLNALTGAITANAAIVPAGTNGSIDVYSEGVTDLVIDINGYFAPPSGAGDLQFYTLTPCRVFDTRDTSGAPRLNKGRDFEIATRCGTPTTARAYSVNATVVPFATLPYLTLWPAARTMPVVSTLNALDGAITSNAAIVPTDNGWIGVYAENSSDVILDINGYFAP